jgi:hypothetical protein
METLEQILRYVLPVIVLWLAYDYARKRPRTKKTVFWAIWCAVFGVAGVVQIVVSLLQPARE